DAKHLRPGMVGDVNEVVRREPEVDGHQHRSHLRHCVERLELLMHIPRDIGDPVALHHPHRLQRRRPPIAPVEELLVGQSQITIDHPQPTSIQLARTPGELEGTQGGFHSGPPNHELSIKAKSVLLIPPTNAPWPCGSSSTERSSTNHKTLREFTSHNTS